MRTTANTDTRVDLSVQPAGKRSRVWVTPGIHFNKV